MKKLFICIISIALVSYCSLFAIEPSFAQNDLGWVKNKFGIHITSDPNDLPLAANLLNSGGGDWGWVTVVIREDELHHQQWQDFFNQCRRLHLIPIIRLATKVENGIWQKPNKDSLVKMARFLASLNWPTKTQFVIIYNEPNRADEWGGKANPREYFEILSFAASLFHQLDPDFFVLSAGLDLAAPQKPPQFYSAENFYQLGYIHQPEAFKLIDGLASHSYPNHGFVGTPNEWGKTSIKGYLWELNYLSQLGVKKKLPVFITETGWPHREGIQSKSSFYSAEKTRKLLAQAFNIWLNDPTVVTITPFILNYSQPPFDHFSWVDHQGKRYPQFDWLQSLPKPVQKPPQEEKIVLEKISLPFLIQANRSYQGKITLKNEGQTIWGEEKFCLQPRQDISSEVKITPLCLKGNQLVEPGQKIAINFEIAFNKATQPTIIFGWEKLPELEIKKIASIFPGHTIYRSKTGIWERVGNLIRRILNPKIKI